MAVTISNVYIQTFEQNVRFLAQQMESKLQGTVMLRSVDSEKHNWDRIGSMTAALKTGQLQETPNSDAVWSRRVSVAETWNVGTAYEQEDPIQMLIDPQSALTREVAYAMRRQMDTIILTAATGTSTDGEGVAVAALGGTQVINNPGQKITFDMVTQVQEVFMNNTIDPDIPKVAVVSPAQVRALMQLTQQTSSDYVNSEALQRLNATGIVPNWMGFTWIVSTLLGTQIGAAANITDGTITQCLFYTEKAIGMQMNRDITVRVAEDPTKSFAWRVYAYMTNGAVRVEDEQIVALQVLN